MRLPFLQFTIELVFQNVIADVKQANATENSPDDAATVFFSAALAPPLELEQWLILMNAGVVHLSMLRCQQYLIRSQQLHMALSNLVRNFSRPATPTQSSVSITSEERNLVKDLRGILINLVSDLSALPDFQDYYPLDSPLIGSLRIWLTLEPPHLQLCACIMLGNLARSDDVCWTMVHDFEVHRPLVEILRSSDDSQVLHGATGFLKNLALITPNKAALGEAGVVEVLVRLWAMETSPQIQYAGASLARQVVSSSIENIERLLTPLSLDPDSPAHSRTYLSLLLLLCEKSDQQPTKTEVARTVTAICRGLNSPQTSMTADELGRLTDRLYALHPDVAWSITTMTGQKQWPVVRSEGWFALALMARSLEGSGLVNEVMTNPEVLRPLIEVLTGKSMSGQSDRDDIAGRSSPEAIPADEADKRVEMRRMDRENALVLISKLLEHRVSQIRQTTLIIMRTTKQMIPGNNDGNSKTSALRRSACGKGARQLGFGQNIGGGKNSDS